MKHQTKLWYVAFATFHGVNAPTTDDFKLSKQCHRTESWEERYTITQYFHCKDTTDITSRTQMKKVYYNNVNFTEVYVSKLD